MLGTVCEWCILWISQSPQGEEVPDKVAKEWTYGCVNRARDMRKPAVIERSIVITKIGECRSRGINAFV